MLNKLRDEIHSLAKEKGWYDGEERKLPELIALIHSELSEALEEYRNGFKPDEVYCNCNCDRSEGNGMPLNPCRNCGEKPEGIPIELADCIIRILDTCGYYGIDIEEAVRIKHEYNKTRARRHGGKVV